MTSSRPEARQPFPPGMTRPGAMKVCVALLACSAILIVVDRRGLLDLGPVAHGVLAWSGDALALAGLVHLLHILWADRFRVTIGRLMLVVAVLFPLGGGGITDDALRARP